MKKLFEVATKATIYAVAESRQEAEEIARQALYNYGDEIGATLIASEYSGGLPGRDWLHSIPFGEINDCTVANWIDDPEGCANG